MRRLAALGLLLLAGCGQHHAAAPARSAPPNVSSQLQQVLTEAIGGRSLEQPRLPFAAVLGCAGPPAGGSGLYRCTLSPARAHGLRHLRVRVHRDGSWATDSFLTSARLHGHALQASTGLWGAGLHLPR